MDEKVFLYGAHIGNVLDKVITYLALSFGMREVNPLVIGLMQYFGNFFGLFFAGFLTVCGLHLIRINPHLSSRRWSLVIVFMGLFAVLVLNIISLW